MSDHARLSPSNLRWPHCPGSVREEAAYPDIPGEAAIDGTGSHLLLEMCILDDRRPEEYVGVLIGTDHEDKPNGWLVDAARAERVQEALSYLERRRQELFDQFPGHTILIVSESKSDPGGMFGRKDWYGTSDITIRVFEGEPFKTPCVFAEVVDYKDGRGYVQPGKNTQLISYLGGKIRPVIASGPELVRPFEPRTLKGLRMTIVQPKTNPSIRYVDVSPEEFIPQLEDLARRAHKTDAPDAELIPGDHCQWCRHKPNCSAVAAGKMETLTTMSTSIATQDAGFLEVIQNALVDVSGLGEEDLSNLDDKITHILGVCQDAADRLEKEIANRIDSGIEVPGFDMLPGRSSRVWALSAEETVKKLKNRKLKQSDIYPPSLASPAQILKLETLTKAQKEAIEKDLVTTMAGPLKLTRVARKPPTFEEQVSVFKEGLDFTKPAPDFIQPPSDDIPDFF